MHYNIDELLHPPKIILPSHIKVVLASASPRRRELCQKMGLCFPICPADCSEDYDRAAVCPKDAVELLSRRKCLAVAESVGEDVLVIASDTMVEVEGEPQGKPRDHDHARKMLQKLSGKSNFVHTGIAVAYGGKCVSGKDTTEVCFREMTEEEILSYANSEEPMDKAGAYAIQGRGGDFISTIKGELDTVVGLSCSLLADYICELVPGAKKWKEEN